MWSYCSGFCLAAKGLVRPNQKLLAGLTAGIKGTYYLYPAKQPAAQQTVIFADERHPLGNAPADNIG